MLSSYNLSRHLRPADGCCGYWSCGTGNGDYDVDSFDLLGNGSCCSPLDYTTANGAEALTSQMIKDRFEVHACILNPDNRYIFRNEWEIWIGTEKLKRHRDKRVGPEWQPPRGKGQLGGVGEWPVRAV